ncbi:MAG: tRNA pseudouridine(38-40) synthase TruA [Planctomycetota bacterium]
MEARKVQLRTYLLQLAYDGGAFSGWQRQSGFDTVQERLEEAFAAVTGETQSVQGSGRTDAGVHALRQMAHVRLPSAWEPPRLLRAVNAHLPDQVRVRHIREVPSSFHARFSAIGKRYVYRTVVDRVQPVFARQYANWTRYEVDLDRMREAAAILRGEHDFVAFSTTPGYERSRGTVRNLRQLRIVRRSYGFDVFAEANGFLYNMVRTLAGTLIDVGRGRFGPEDVRAMLESKDRRRAGVNAPPEGLYLLRALYSPEALSLTATVAVGEASTIPNERSEA